MASNIDNLNFKVILDDKDFNTRVEKDIELAKKLNVELSQLLQAKVKVNSISATEAASAKRASDILTKQATNQEKISQAKAKTAEAEEKVATQAAKTAKEMERGRTAASQTAVNVQRLATEQQRTAAATQNAATATSRAALAQKRLRDYASQATNSIRSQSRLMNELKGYALGYLSIHGATQLISSLVRVTGEFELQKTTLAAMLGDLNQAEQIITRIQGLAVESPFQFKELTTYAKQLSAFSVPAEELYETTKMLADVSAGLGVGMDRIVLAYGQVRSAAFLRGQEVRQFTEAGIPILDELAKQFTELEGRAVSTGEVFDKISKRMVPFEMVAKVFKDMTSEGGKFFNMQAVQAETLRGKIFNLEDAYEIMLNEIGENQSEKLKDAVDWAKKLMQNYEDTGRTLVELVAAYGTYRVALIVVTNLQTTLARNLVVLRKSFRALYATISANPYALLAASITAMGFAIYKASTDLKDYEKIQKSVVDTQKEYVSSVASEAVKLDSLYAKLRLAKVGTEEYAKAKKDIYSQYASYISELKNEGKEVDNLAGIYNDLKEKIEASAKAKYRMTARQGIENEYATAMDAFYKRFELLSTNMGNSLKRKLMEVEKEALWKYLLGDETALNIPEAEGIRNIAKDMGPSGYGYLVKKAQKDAKDIFDAYANAKERIDALFGTETGLEGTMNNFEFPELEPDESFAKTIQKEIDAVKRLKDAYDALAPYLNGEMLRKTLTALFPNADQQLIQSLDFRGKLVELAAQLNEFDKDASQKLLDTISGEKAGDIVTVFKEIEKYKKTIDSWLGEDFNLTGEGVTFDISKIIRDLNNQYTKINEKAIRASDLLTQAQMGDEEALKLVREVYGEEVWQKYLTNGQKTIDELAKREREAARKTADEKIKDLSDKYVKEQMDKKNISLSDFEDKSVAQIQSMIDRMKEIQQEAEAMANKSLAEVLLGNLDEGQYAKWQMLLDVIELLGVKISDTEEELKKKVVDTAIDGINAISNLGGEISSLGDAIGNSNISKLGDGLERTANAASGIIKALEADDTISLISNIVSYAITSISDVFSSAYKQQRALNEATEEYRQMLLDIRREVYSGVFGTDEIGLAAENAKILAEAQKQYEEALDKFENDKKTRRNKYTNSLVFQKQSVSDVLDDIASMQGWNLYDEAGELDFEALKANYDAYYDYLTNKQKEVVDAVIAGYNAQDEAARHSAEYLTNLFSGVADSIADGMIDAFLESGDAAMDMGDIISDVSRKMVADLIKSVYLMPILNSYQKQFDAISEDTSLSPTQKTEKQLLLLDTALREISDQSGSISDAIARFEDYLGTGEEGTKDLGEGTKGITEDQANLLASYLNAIRADVASSKALWVKMDGNLQRIADILASSPSLMEYQAQIAANTYNTAIATQDILSELRSVITTDSGDTAIRVYS